jgi:hypothetical protein
LLNIRNVISHKTDLTKRIKDGGFRRNTDNTLIIIVCYRNCNAKVHEMHIGIALRAVASLM